MVRTVGLDIGCDAPRVKADMAGGWIVGRTLTHIKLQRHTVVQPTVAHCRASRTQRRHRPVLNDKSETFASAVADVADLKGKRSFKSVPQISFLTMPDAANLADRGRRQHHPLSGN